MLRLSFSQSSSPHLHVMSGIGWDWSKSMESIDEARRVNRKTMVLGREILGKRECEVQKTRRSSGVGGGSDKEQRYSPDGRELRSSRPLCWEPNCQTLGRDKELPLLLLTCRLHCPSTERRLLSPPVAAPTGSLRPAAAADSL